MVQIFTHDTFMDDASSASAEEGEVERDYRGTSLMRKRTPLGPYSRTMPRALWWS